MTEPSPAPAPPAPPETRPPPRSGLNWPGPGSEWTKTRRRQRFDLVPAIRPHWLLLTILTVGASATWAWDEGNDAVNVISVENMDALLGLRMVTELKSFEGVKTNETGDRVANGTDTEDPGPKSDREPGQEPSQEPDQEPGQSPTQEPGPEAGQEPSQDPGQEPGQKPAQEPIQEPETRSRRMVNSKRSPSGHPSAESIDLCSSNACECRNIGKGHLDLSCHFDGDEINLKPGSIPLNTRELRISNAKQLRILPGTFFNHTKLHKASFINLNNLSISSTAFQGLSTVPFGLAIENCKSVTLEDHSFRSLQSPLSVTIVNCDRVSLGKSVFYWFSHVQIVNAPNLELTENTFLSEVRQDVQSTETQMSFVNVTVGEIPNATFPLNSAKIAFANSTIGTIESGAFNGIVLVSVTFQSSRIERIQGGAFSERTLIQKVEFDDVDIAHVDANALSAAARFTIQNCRIEEMTTEAFNVNTAYLKLLNNDFGKIREYAFEIQNWNSIIVHGNHFQSLEKNFFSAPYSNITTVTSEFVFTNNTLVDVGLDVLSFLPNEHGLQLNVENNVFANVCHCQLETWVQERTGTSWKRFYETSHCIITDLLEQCYNITAGSMVMKEYVDEHCDPEDVVICKDVRRTFRPNILTPLNLHNTEQTLLGVIFLGVVSSIAIMLSIMSVMWIRERSFCGKKRKLPQPPPSPNTRFCPIFPRLWHNRNLVVSDSISRVNIHEYAEIQNRLNDQQKQTTLIIEDDADLDDEMVVYENKATQTIPEELTQELLQSLREKLDDPENYNEARDMIEHLYDLIKVEESCNNNNESRTNSFTFDDEEEVGGIYEVIQTSKLTPFNSAGKAKRKNHGVDVVSTGTRAPSPDKLSPITFTVKRPLPTIVTDYVEPRDRKSNEYCELSSGNHIMPDVLTSSQVKETTTNSPKMHIYAEPLQCVKRPSPTHKSAQPGPSDS